MAKVSKPFDERDYARGAWNGGAPLLERQVRRDES